jgi:hypothetical protein
MKDVDYDWLNKAVALANEGGSEEKLFALADVGEKV